MDSYRDCLEVTERVDESLRQDRQNADDDDDRALDRANTLRCLGNVQSKLGRTEAALQNYQRARKILEGRHENLPYATVHTEIAGLHLEGGRHRHHRRSSNNSNSSSNTLTNHDAVDYLRESLHIRRHHADTHPDPIERLRAKSGVADNLYSLACADYLKGDAARASTGLEEARELRRTLSKVVLPNASEEDERVVRGIRQDQAKPILLLLSLTGKVYAHRQEYQKALACYDEQMIVNKKNLTARSTTEGERDVESVLSHESPVTAHRRRHDLDDEDENEDRVSRRPEEIVLVVLLPRMPNSHPGPTNNQIQTRNEATKTP